MKSVLLVMIIAFFFPVLLFSTQQSREDGLANEYVKEIRGAGYFDAAFQTNDGGYITVGVRYEPQGIFTVSKFSVSGKKEWKNSLLDQTEPHHYPHIRGITQTSDGYLLVGGCYGTSNVPGIVIKLNTLGNFVWGKHISGPGFQLPAFDLYSVTGQPDGTFIATGITSDDPMYGANPVVMKFGESGNIIWIKRFTQFNNWNIASSPTSDNGFIMAITRWADSQPAGVHLLKVNANGNAVWNRELLMNQFSPYTIRQTSDGTIVLLDGVTMVKLSPSGHFQLAAKYSLNNKQDRYLNLQDAIQTTDGSYAVAGSIQFFDWSRFATVTVGGVFLKIDRQGNVVSAKQFGSGQGVTGSAIFSSADQGYAIFGLGSFDSQLMLQVNSSGLASGCSYIKSAPAVTPEFISGIKTNKFQLVKPSPTLFTITDLKLNSTSLKDEIETICK